MFDWESSQKRRVYALLDTDTSWVIERFGSNVSTKSSARITDSFERFLIALFGSSSLLNTQPGGRRLDFIPSRTELALLSNSSTAVMQKISESVLTNANEHIKLRLSAIAETICDWVRDEVPENKLTEANLQHVKTHYVKQASSDLLHGFCISAIVGDTVTEQAIRENTGFFDGDSATQELLRSYLGECVDCETDFASKHLDDLLRLVSFANVFNWRHKASRKADLNAKRMLHSYLGTVEPLLTITLSERSLSNCLPSPSRNLIREVGNARIVSVGNAPQSTSTIILPQHHPGYDARTDQSPKYRRLYFLCWIHVWVYMDAILTVLTSMRPPNLTLHRYELCQKIMACAEARLDAVQFKNALRKAKEEFTEHSELRNRLRMQSTDAKKKSSEKKRGFSESTGHPDLESWLAHIAEKSSYLKRLRHLSSTLANPRSRDRIKWAENKWKDRESDLKREFPTSSRRDWISFAVDLPTGYYTAVCIDASKDITGLPEAIQDLFRTKAKERNIGLDNLTTKAKRDILESIAQEMVQDQADHKKAKNRKRDEYKIGTLRGVDFGTSTGKSRFTCEGVDGSKRKIVFPNSCSLLRHQSQFSRRMFEFDEAGLNVKDEHGKVLYPPDSPKSGVSIPINQLEDFAENLRWFWEQGLAATKNDGFGDGRFVGDEQDP
ncbi:hypothetical protein AYL99_12021 [Fonsecaea erecta]|uniref:Uncharacterized protein n=1 Tax=Fonsecaea erecta TaxID=1367422 RepID=A0A178Z1V5_9EURO|nr:hypothetical protein AYL99_12021 [Fonsecaea erecta]OAP53778.1 hypothetical protein AYL99_12021 [Fonsecaea erecta]